MIDVNTLIQLLRITAELTEQCKTLEAEPETTAVERMIHTLEDLASI